jgi:tripartite ATP-independent transporter DctP family solute receptor
VVSAGVLAVALVGTSASALELKLGTVTAPGQPRTMLGEQFGKRVKELTNGEVTVSVFHSSQLGKPREVLEGMSLGTVDMAIEASGLVAGLVPKFNVVYLPFRWRDEGHLASFIKSPTWNSWTKELQDTKSIRTLVAVTTYPRELLTVPGPIDKPEDIAGKKLRVPESAAPIAIWKAIGASPVPVAYAESYQALQQGVVAGVEADPANMVGVSWYEVAKNLTMTDHTIDAWTIMISEHSWSRLSAAQKEAFTKAAGEMQAYMAEIDVKGTRRRSSAWSMPA